MANRADWITYALRDWAAWQLDAIEWDEVTTAWPSATTIYHAMRAYNTPKPEFTSRLPNGVIAPRTLADVAHAMTVLRQDADLGRPVNATAAYYIAMHKRPRGPKTSKEAAAEAARAISAYMQPITGSQLYGLKRQGEIAIKAFVMGMPADV